MFCSVHLIKNEGPSGANLKKRRKKETEPDFQFPVQEPDKNDEYCKIETGLENITVTMAANLPSLVVSPVAQAGKGIVGEGV